MAYIVTDSCLRCKYTDCVVVCPVDCFHEGKNMLVIDPDQCIDCGVCEPECPAEAIQPATESNIKWQEINHEMSKVWPSITASKMPFPDAEKHKHETDKFEKYFQENISK